jgi:hypothetical protein
VTVKHLLPWNVIHRLRIGRTSGSQQCPTHPKVLLLLLLTTNRTPTLNSGLVGDLEAQNSLQHDQAQVSRQSLSPLRNGKARS